MARITPNTYLLEDYIETLHFTPDGSTLVSALTHNDVILWRVSTEQLEQQFLFPSGLKRLYDIALSPDGTRLATAGLAASGQKQLSLWKLPQGEKINEFGFLDAYLLSAAFSPDGTRLLAAGSKEMLYVVDLRIGKIEFTAGAEPLDDDEDFWGLGERNTSIVYHPDGRTVLITACFQAGSLVVFCEVNQSGLTPRPDLTVDLAYDVLTPAAFSPDGRFFAFADWNVNLHSFPDLKLTGVFSPEGGRLAGPTGKPVVRQFWSNALFTPDSRTLICGSPRGSIFLWDVPSGNLRQTLTGHEGGILALALNPAGTRLVSSGRDKTLRLWQMPS
jgi:WD40 repeat protein